MMPSYRWIFFPVYWYLLTRELWQYVLLYWINTHSQYKNTTYKLFYAIRNYSHTPRIVCIGELPWLESRRLTILSAAKLFACLQLHWTLVRPNYIVESILQVMLSHGQPFSFYWLRELVGNKRCLEMSNQVMFDSVALCCSWFYIPVMSVGNEFGGL